MRKNIYKGKIVKEFLLVISIWTLAIVILYACYTLPKNERWQRNFMDSYYEMVEEGVYPHVITIGEQKWDNYTASCFLNWLYFINNANPLISGIKMEVATSSVFNKNDIIYSNIGALIEGDEVEHWNYSRYWGGHNIVLYPFLFIKSIKYLRLSLFLIEITLECIIVYICNKKETYSLGIALVVASVMAQWQLNSMCLVYSIDIILTLLAIIIWDFFKGRISSIAYSIMLGGLTMFFCMLSTPLITLGCWLCFYYYNDENNDKIKRIINTIKLSIGWVIGYVSMMEIKGVLAKLAGFEESGNSRAFELFGNGSLAERITTSIEVAYAFILPWKLLCIGFVFIWIIAIIFLKKYKQLGRIAGNMGMIVIAFYPFVWEMVFFAHTNHGHERNLFAISVLAFMTILLSPFDNFKIAENKSLVP